MSDHKNDRVGERLSGMLDGELSPAEQDKMAKRLAENAALRRKLGRYQRISAGVQKLPDESIDASGIAERVSAQLADEPVVLAPQKRRPVQVPRVALGAALAATVAAIAVGVAPGLLDPALDEAAAPAPETFAFTPELSVPKFSATTVAIGGGAEPVVTANPLLSEGRWKTLKPDAQKKLDRYLLEHSEYAGRLGVSPANAHISFFNNDDAQD